jgi:anti-sigma factor RsiW
MVEELDRKSSLLLYLADELAPAEHAEIERRCADDPALACELQELRQAMDAFTAGMSQLDAHSLAGDGAAVRRIGFAMRNQLARGGPPLRLPEGKVSVVHRRLGLLYGGSAVAAALIAGLCWWGYVNAHSSKANTIASAALHAALREHAIPPVGPVAPDEGKSAGDLAGDSLPDQNPAESPKSVASLERAEQQLAELAQSSGNPLPSVFGETGGNE